MRRPLRVSLVVCVAVLMIGAPVSGATAPAQSGIGSNGLTAGETPASVSDTPEQGTAVDDRTTDGTATDEDSNITAVEPDSTEVVEVDREPEYSIPFRAETVTPEPGLDPAVTDSPTDRTWVIVQFVASPTSELLDSMAELGYEDAGRLTTTARYANIPVETAEDIAAREEVRSVLSVEPQWRVHPDLLETASTEEETTVTVLTFEPLSTEGTPLQEVEANTYRGTLTEDEIRALAEDPRVKWMDEFVPPEPTASEGRRLVGAHMAERAGPGSRTGYNGTGVEVAVLDTGILANHPHFDSTNIVQGYDWADNDGNSTSTTCTHGQHVAGTIAGNGTDSSRGVTITGVAEDATIIASRIFDDNCDWATARTGPKRKFKKVNDEGADIISNSWGDTAAASDGDYDIQASKTDTWAKNHEDTLLVFANGNFNQTAANNGIVPASQQYINSPALAKNVIAVGAIRDGSRFPSGNVTDGTIDTVNDDSFLNNLQPSLDMDRGSDRRKPELYAPGHWTTAPVNSGYDEKLGTSMATPHVSGVAALLKDKYQNDPSLEMDANAMRAELIATAAPPNHDGYGIVNANNAMFDNFYESRHAHMSGTVQEAGLFQKPAVEVDKKSFFVEEDAEKVVVALTWLDPGHQPTLKGSGSNILANDLDLIVEGPDDTHKITTNSNVKRLVLDDPSDGSYTIKVRANRVTAFTKQAYDVVYRTVTEKPTLEVTENETETIQPWESRQQAFNFSVEGTGAPVSGTTVDVEFSDPSSMQQCGGWRDPTVVGMMSESQDYTKDICVELPSVSTKRTVNVTVEVDSSNAASIGGTQSRSVTRHKTFVLLPPPEADRFDDPGSNDFLSTATNVTNENGWDHSHLICVGNDRFSAGKGYGADCSGVLTGGDEVFAREYWETGLQNLSLDSDFDTDYYELDIPETDTPKLPRPECGSQNVTIGGSKTEIKTDGKLVIEIDGVSNKLGDAVARTDPSATPIVVYDDGSKVSTGTLNSQYGGSIALTIDCPQSKAGLDDLTISFGEGAADNAGGYEIDVYYSINVKNVEGYNEAVRDRITDAIGAKEILENAPFYERLPDLDDIEVIIDNFDEDGKPACFTHCGYPTGPPGRFLGERIQFGVTNALGETVGQYALVTGDGGVTEFRRLEDPEAFEQTMGMETGILTTRLLSTAEQPGRGVAAAYRQGMLQFDAPGFLDGLYVGAPTIALGPEGDATVSVTSTYDLTTDSGAEAFESLRADEEFRERLSETFEMRMRWVADEWSTRAEREMAVVEPRLTFDTREGDEIGVVSLSVDWYGFATATDSGLRIARPFAPAFVTDQPLELRVPEGYRLEDASVEPTSVDGSTIRWASGLRMEEFGVVLG